MHKFLSITLLGFVLFVQLHYNNALGKNFENTTIETYKTIPKDINGIKCDKTEHLLFHNHTRLVIRGEGNKIAEIPANIGILPQNCIFWLHTHDNSGIIHVESPINRSFTLGNFLDIWKVFDNSPIVMTLGGNHSDKIPMKISVDNTTINPSSTSIKDIILKDRSTISIELTNN